MVHYLLLRFKENALTESIIDVFADKFESLEKQHEGIVNPQVYRNIVSREGNMDLMITVEMRSLEDLKTYLESPEHAELQERYKDPAALQTSFAHNQLQNTGNRPHAPPLSSAPTRVAASLARTERSHSSLVIVTCQQ